MRGTGGGGIGPYYLILPYPGFQQFLARPQLPESEKPLGPRVMLPTLAYQLRSCPFSYQPPKMITSNIVVVVSRIIRTLIKQPPTPSSPFIHTREQNMKLGEKGHCNWCWFSRDDKDEPQGWEGEGEWEWGDDGGDGEGGGEVVGNSQGKGVL